MDKYDLTALAGKRDSRYIAGLLVSRAGWGDIRAVLYDRMDEIRDYMQKFMECGAVSYDRESGFIVEKECLDDDDYISCTGKAEEYNKCQRLYNENFSWYNYGRYTKNKGG